MLVFNYYIFCLYKDPILFFYQSIYQPYAHEQCPTQGLFFKRSLADLYSFFFLKPVAKPRFKNPGLPFYLSIAEGKIVGAHLSHVY